MSKVMSDIYPEELALTSDDAISQVNYLDLTLTIKAHQITYKLFDKRDSFNFRIINFPNLSGNIPNKQSYGVFTSQLIRFARCCQFIIDFKERTITLITRLLSQHFTWSMLRTTFTKFTYKYYYLLDNYDYAGVEFCKVCRQGNEFFVDTVV